MDLGIWPTTTWEQLGEVDGHIFIVRKVSKMFKNHIWKNTSWKMWQQNESNLKESKENSESKLS
jgi:hypothetical protein